MQRPFRIAVPRRRRHAPARAGAVLLALAVLAGAGGAAALAQGQGAPAGGADPRAVRRQVEFGVVAVRARVVADDVYSTGVVFDGAQGLVVTTAHTLWGAQSLRVATGLGVLFGRIVARSPCDDLAVIQVQPRLPGLGPLPAAQAALRPPSAFTAVERRWGAPASVPNALAASTARALGAAPPAAAARDLRPPAEAVAMSADSAAPAAGAPLLDGASRIVGLLQAIPGAPVTALPWSVVRARMSELRPGRSTVFEGWRRHYACASQMHALAKRLHRGYRRSDANLNPPVAAERVPGVQVR